MSAREGEPERGIDPERRTFPELEVIDLKPELYARYAEALGLESTDIAAVVLAATVQRDPWWESAPSTTMVVRRGERPLLGAMGRYPAEFRQRLAVQARGLRRGLKGFQWLSYPEVEALTAVLAERLRAALGEERLRRARFQAIPRGGIVVLGLLAYQLGLSAHQLRPDSEPEELCVLVDDLSLSGLRLSQALESCRAREILFAPLLSPVPLREAIRSNAGRHVDVVSARDLPDRTAELEAGSDTGRVPWENRLREPRYWFGVTDHVCFPWMEPDRLVYQESLDVVEPAWRIVPADHCLGNAHLRPYPEMTPIQVMRTGEGEFQAAEGVLAGEWSGGVVLAHTETGARLGLDPTAAKFWELVLGSQTFEEALDWLSEWFDGAPETLRSDLLAFIRSLQSDGFLTGKL